MKVLTISEATPAEPDGEDSDAKRVGDKEMATTSVEIPSDLNRPANDLEQETPNGVGADAYRASLQRAVVRSTIFSLVFALVVGILIPLPMFFTEYLFSRRFFEVWVG